MITIVDLKEARTKLGLSQAAFARKLGVDQTTVWGWEKADALPKNELILDSLERRVQALLEAEEAA
jgi:DNA-binding transcriptional regulator YiaG